MCFKTETALEVLLGYDQDHHHIMCHKVKLDTPLVTSGSNERCRICTVNICMTAQGKIIGKI